MKTVYPLLAVLSLLAFGGCGKSGSNPSGQTASSSSGPREIDLTANDTMHYNITTITAKPGEPLHVVLTNTGTQPKEVMGHDWVLLKAGSDAAAFSQAAVTHKADGYMPPELMNEVIAKIDLLGPRQTGEVTFNAPTQPGNYPFLCTFPAHYQAGMHGTLTVQ